jgi:hypothetical protein
VHDNLKTIHNVLRTLVHTSPPRNMTQARDIINELATAMHAMQTTVATTVGSSPGSLAFARDMFLKVPLITDWQAKKRMLVNIMSNDNLQCANRKQCQND